MTDTPNLTFRKYDRDTYIVLTVNDTIIGEIKRKRFKNHFQWCYMPTPIITIGDIFLTSKSIREIFEKVIELQTNEKGLT